MNLSILLEDEDVSACTLADLPTNSDVINALEKTIIEKLSTSLIVNNCALLFGKTVIVNTNGSLLM